jgi:hypothetical protein
MEETIKLCEENNEQSICLLDEDSEQVLSVDKEMISVGGAVYSVNGQTGDVVLTTSDIENTSGYVTESELAPVATSGSYNDLSDKPDIPPEITVDDSLSTTSVNPVQNNVITTALAGKVDSDDLAEVAFTGDYEDLENEPQDFTQEQWDLLWTTYH